MSVSPLAAEVLVADDSVTTTAMLKMLLERAGYRVRVAHSGTEALEQIGKSLPDLVLCDIEMPGLDGYQVLERFRSNPAADCVPFILITSKSTTEDKIRGLDRGATDYVTKPFKIEELKARIRTHLRVKALQDEVLAKNRELSRTQKLLEEKIEALRSAYQKIAEHQTRMRRALDLASKVQRGLLPSVAPAVPGYSVSSVFRPAEEVAGDFYDFIDLADGKLGIAIGDVAGKGVAASLVMVLIRTLLRSVAASGGSPRDVLERVNQLIIKDYGSQDSTTLFYGVLDTERGLFTFANGGHEYPILISRDAQSSIELCVGGPFLGIFPRARYNQGRVALRAQDRITLFTDGLYHLSWASGELESSERLIELLRSSPMASLDSVLRALGYDPSSTSRSLDPRADDITVIQISCEKSTDTTDLGGLVIHNSPSNLRETEAMVDGLARRGGLSSQAAVELTSASRAIVENAVLHAYAGENTGLVELHLGCADGAVTVRVSDDGRAYAKGSRPGLAADGPVLSRARELTDGLEISANGQGRGTTVTLSKKLT